jgi:excisionase family DNA binding protein
MAERISYTRKQAAEATGLSTDVIDRAIREGNLPTVRPAVGDRKITTVLITHAALTHWIGAGA